jgi:hypothetical protein
MCNPQKANFFCVSNNTNLETFFGSTTTLSRLTGLWIQMHDQKLTMEKLSNNLQHSNFVDNKKTCGR